MGGIEFLDDPVPPTYAQPAGPRRPTGGRRVLSAFVLAGVVLVGLLVGRAVTSGGRHALPAVATSSGATATSRSDAAIPVATCRQTTGAPVATQTVDRPSGTPVTIEVPGRGSRTITCSQEAAQCPQATDGQNACATTSTVPHAVLAVVREHFRTAQLTSARTEVIRENGNLWFRYLRFRLSGHSELAVEVVRGHPDDQPAGEWDDGGGVFSRAAVGRDGGMTLVTLTSPSGSGSMLAQQYALARESALATV